MRRVLVIVSIGVVLLWGLSSPALGTRVIIGGSFWYPWYPYYPYPYPYPYYGYPYPYYPYPRYDVPYQPPVAHNVPPQQEYWYYCGEAQGYYPYVASCPAGWTKVLPAPPPENKGG